MNFEIINKYILNEIKELQKYKVTGLDIIDVSDNKKHYSIFLLHQNHKNYLEVMNKDYFEKGFPSLLFNDKSHVVEEELDEREDDTSLSEINFFSQELQFQNVDLAKFNPLNKSIYWREWLNVCNRCLNYDYLFFVRQDIPDTNYFSGAFLYLKRKNIEDSTLDISRDKRHITRILTNFLSYRLSTKLIPEQVEKIKNSALKSSLAAVMSRNMSHNIGSHVLNQLSSESLISIFFHTQKEKKNFLGLSCDEITSGSLCTVDGIYKINSSYFTSSKPKDIHKHTSPIELTRVFNDYMKKRMDFVADVATTNNSSLLSNKHLFSDVFRNFQKNLLLLQHISGKGKEFKYEFALEIVKTIDGEKKIIKQGEDGFFDPIVAIQNDVLGDQAFYIILENIIRNTAKHSGCKVPESANGRITFTIQVEVDDKEGFHKINVFDNVVQESADYINKLVEDRNENIALPVLDKNTNEIRSKGWGTIELKIAACYLSGLSSDNIDDAKYAPITPEGTLSFPILKAINGLGSEVNNGFGYTFYLKKPKVVLIYDPNNSLFLSNNEIKELKKLGIDVKSSLDDSKTYPHHYFIDCGDVDVEIIGNLPHEVYFYNATSNCLSYYQRNSDWKTNIDISKKLKESLKAQNTYEVLDSLNKLFYMMFAAVPIKINLSDIFYNYSNTRLIGSSGINFRNDKFIAGLNHHGVAIDEFNKYDYCEFFGSSSNLMFQLDAYVEKVDSKENKEEKIKQKKINRNDFFYLMQQAINTKVVIIDERIQDALNDVGFTSEESQGVRGFEYKNEELFNKMNLKVPGKPLFNLNSKDISEHKGAIFAYIEENCKDSDFLIIHYGIIESLRKKNIDEKHILREIHGIIGTNCKIVITSGRGFTPDIKSLDEYFLPYSNLSNLVINPINRSKNSLVRLLKSIRKI